MKITPRIAMEVAHHEAIVREAYLDSVNVWTWSVGLTNATGHNVERYKGRPQPLAQCLRIYVWALDNYADHVREFFKDDDLSEEQFAAVLSFVWNLGPGALHKASWVGAFRRGDHADAERRWKMWNKAGGQVNRGLTKRRADECDLFFRDKWAHGRTLTEYGVTASHRPDWSSAQQMDALPVLQAVMAETTDMEPPKDDAPEVAPELPFDREGALAELARAKSAIEKAMAKVRQA